MTNFVFVDRHAYIDEEVTGFSVKPLLEAAIITRRGQRDGNPIDIVTHWNVPPMGL